MLISLFKDTKAELNIFLISTHHIKALNLLLKNHSEPLKPNRCKFESYRGHGCFVVVLGILKIQK